MTQSKYDIAINHDTLKEYALDFADAGFRVMRLHGITEDGNCACGWELCKTPGKHPVSKGWSQLPHVDESTIESWFATSGIIRHGLGIVLDKNILIVDVDEKNGGHKTLPKFEKEIGAKLDEICTFVVHSGSGGRSRHYWFEKPEDFSVRKNLKEYPGLDFLTGGSYVVMPGSVHVSGGVYHCDGNKNDPQVISDAPESLLQIIKREVRTDITDAPEPGSCDVSELQDALSAIPNTIDTSYDEEWFPIGAGLYYEFDGGEHGFNLWMNWSEKGPKHDPTMMRYKWESFANAPSQARYNGGTIFRIAIEHGWERDYSKLVDISDFLQRIENGEAQQVVIAVENVKSQTTEFKSDKVPPSLQRPPGIIGQIADYIMSTAPKPLFLPSIQAALSFVGTSLGRCYRTNRGNYSNTYAIVLAPTGGGKEHCLQCVETLLESTGQADSVMGMPTSQGGIQTELILNPIKISVVDEIGHVLESLSGKVRSKEAAEVAKSYLSLFGRSNRTFAPASYSRMTDMKAGVADVNKEDLTVKKPSMSFYGTSTPAKTIENINKRLIFDGYLNRHIVVIAHEGRQKRNKNLQIKPVPANVLDWVNAVNDRFLRTVGEAEAIKKYKYDQSPNEVIINFTAESEDLIDEFEDWTIEQAEKSKNGMDEMYVRCVEQAMKHALICAMASNPYTNEVDYDSTKWAIDWVKYHTKETVKLISLKMVETKIEEWYRDAAEAIGRYKSKGVSKTEMMRDKPFKGMTTAEKDNVLKYLTDAGYVIMRAVEGKGRPKQMYYHTDYVKVEECGEESD